MPYTRERGAQDRLCKGIQRADVGGPGSTESSTVCVAGCGQVHVCGGMAELSQDQSGLSSAPGTVVNQVRHQMSQRAGELRSPHVRVFNEIESRVSPLWVCQAAA